MDGAAVNTITATIPPLASRNQIGMPSGLLARHAWAERLQFPGAALRPPRHAGADIPPPPVGDGGSNQGPRTRRLGPGYRADGQSLQATDPCDSPRAVRPA